MSRNLEDTIQKLKMKKIIEDKIEAKKAKIIHDDFESFFLLLSDPKRNLDFNDTRIVNVFRYTIWCNL